VTHLRDLFDDSAGTTPPSSLRADAVYAAGRRRRALAAAARSALVVLTVTAISSAAYGAIRLTARPSDVADGARRGTVVDYAIDGEHMYAAVVDCPVSPTTDPSGSPPVKDPSGTPPTGAPGYPSVDPTLDPSTDPTTGPTLDPTGQPSGDPTTGPPVDPTTGPEPTLEPTPSYDPCTIRLIASDDHGRHWSQRTPAPSEYGLTSPAPGVLAAGYVHDTGPMISTDGARTWRRVTRAGTTIPQVPAGGWATMADGGDGKVLGVDPGSARMAALAHQPPFKVTRVSSVAGKGILVAMNDGHIRDDKAATEFAISVDNGRSWSPTRRVPNGTRPAAGDPVTAWMAVVPEDVTTVDGTNVYLVRADRPGAGQVVYSSNDGGATWRKRSLPGVTASSSYVALDGAHVVVATDDNRTTVWVSRDRGASYRRVTAMPGLPAQDSMFLVRMLPQGDYVAQEFGAFASPIGGSPFYRSTDGWNWERIDVG
jgi:hypothetical protein